MNMKTLNDIKNLLNEVSDRIKDGEREINFKDDQHYVSYFEGYVSALTWVEEILGFIIDEKSNDEYEEEQHLKAEAKQAAKEDEEIEEKLFQMDIYTR